MNLSEQLQYFNTDILLQFMSNRTSNEYYNALLTLKEKQDSGAVVTDEEYSALPGCGLPNYWSAADGYYHVNFHYWFYYFEEINKDELVDSFLKFLTIVDFSKCRESESLNWDASFNYFFTRNADSLFEETVSKCCAIKEVLSLINPIKKNTLEFVISNINKELESLYPRLYLNMLNYFNYKNNNLQALIDRYADKQSLKANEVMELLDISRVTLCHYVKRGLIKIDTNYTGKQYRYNKESVLALMKGSK